MKVKIIDAGQVGGKESPREFEMKEPIPIPKGKDIYIHVPEGVYRCNINEGIFPEDRYFLHGLTSTSSHAKPYIIHYNRIAHLSNPVLSIKVHYPGPPSEADVLVEFRPASSH